MSGGAVIVMRQNRYIRVFRQAAANSPDTARALDELQLRDSRIFRRMTSRGVFVETAGNRWYLSVPAAEAFIRRRRRIMLAFVAVGIVLFVLVTVLVAR